jgi:hypothetical protein
MFRMVFSLTLSIHPNPAVRFYQRYLRHFAHDEHAAPHHKRVNSPIERDFSDYFSVFGPDQPLSIFYTKNRF